MFLFSAGHASVRRWRRCAATVMLIFVMQATAGCSLIDVIGDRINPNAVIDRAINEINDTQLALGNQSTAWRDQLNKLVNDLSTLQSQATSDVRDVITDAMNQVRGTMNDTLALTDSTASDIIYKAGAEARCNAEFVKEGALQQLAYIKARLQFWKQHQTTAVPRPNHQVCALNPSSLSLYPVGNSWLIDTTAMPDHLLKLYGYNFWGDQVPKLALHNASGQKVRQVNATPAYVTHYQFNLDLSTDNFSDIQSGWRIQFEWPDVADPNSISLIPRPPAQLAITGVTWSPASPQATRDLVYPTVTIVNNGGSPSGSFNVKWTTPANARVQEKPGAYALQPGQSVQVRFDAIYFPKCGAIASNFSLSDGSDSKNASLQVRPYCAAVTNPTPFPERRLGEWTSTVDQLYVPVGSSDTREFGSNCDAGYHFSRQTVSGAKSGANAGCYFKEMVSSDTHFCKVRVRIWADGFSKVVCTIQIYESGDPLPTPQPSPACSCQ